MNYVLTISLIYVKLYKKMIIIKGNINGTKSRKYTVNR
jgi:hypothetical protein